MRTRFHEKLDDLAGRVNELVSVVDSAMRDASAALLRADSRLADAVIDAEGAIATRQCDMDEVALDLLAREQPVATDLRTIVACLRISVDLRRMGKLATHIAEIARAHAPDGAVPDELRPTVTEMADRVHRITAAAARVVATRDAAAVTGLEQADEELDVLQERLHHQLFGLPGPQDLRRAMDMTLVGRYLERYADHAVAIARRIAYVAGTSTLDVAPAGS